MYVCLGVSHLDRKTTFNIMLEYEKFGILFLTYHVGYYNIACVRILISPGKLFLASLSPLLASLSLFF